MFPFPPPPPPQPKKIAHTKNTKAKTFDHLSIMLLATYLNFV